MQPVDLWDPFKFDSMRPKNNWIDNVVKFPKKKNGKKKGRKKERKEERERKKKIIRFQEFRSTWKIQRRAQVVLLGFSGSVLLGEAGKEGRE